MAGIRTPGHRPFLFVAAARRGHDQIASQQDPGRWHGLALPQRAQARIERLSMRVVLALALVTLTAAALAFGKLADLRNGALPEGEPPLPKIAAAPGFTLTSQDGAPVRLADFRGKVVAVTFIFTLCSDTCPV